MLPTLTNRLWAVVFGGLVLAPLLFGNATISVTIPDRTPLVPVAKVKITLELGGPAAGSSITIGGTLINIGNSDIVNGDQIDFDPLVGLPNQARITFHPNNNLAVGSLCALKPAVLSGLQNVTITFTSAQAVSGFRANFYTVAADIAANARDCGQAPRRVKTAVGSVTSTQGTFLGRHPLDVMLVLDKSGSMGGFPPGGGPDTKWQILDPGVEQFISLWEAADGVITPGGGLAANLQNDTMAVAFFGSTTIPALPAGLTFVGRCPVLPCAMNPWAPINTAVNGQGPGGATAMGPGTQLAIDAWTALPITRNDPTIVLMTDGMQNVAPLFATDMAGDLRIGAGPKLATLGIPILTIGVGAPGGTIDTQKLDQISKQSAGKATIALDSLAMINGFKDALVEALKGNTIGLYSRDVATMAAGVNNSPPVTVTVDKSISRIVIELLTLDGGKDGFGFVTARNPSGVTAAPEFQRGGASWRHLIFDKPALGDWTFQVARGQTRESFRYQLSIFAVDDSLAYRTEVSNPRPGTGEDLLVTAEISYDGKPLTGLLNGVQARVQRPGEALGNLTRTAGFDPTPSTGPDPLTPADQKIAKVVQDNLSRLTPQDVPGTIVLRDDGTNGDLRPNDGIYSGRFANTTTPGLYRVFITMDWNTPQTGVVKRKEKIERDVRLLPDPASTQVTTQPIAASPGAFQVTVTPRDRFGNYIAPGFGSVIRVTPTAGFVAGPPVDQLNGTYVFRIDGVPAGTTPGIGVIADGVNIPPKGGPVLAGKHSFFIHVGPNFPHGTAGKGFGTGVSVNLGLEHKFTPLTAIEAVYGQHHLRGKASSADIHQLSANFKQYASSGVTRLYLQAGFGGYFFTPGVNRPGTNVGIGIQRDILGRTAVEGAYNFHSIFLPGSTFNMSTLQVGLRIRF